MKEADGVTLEHLTFRLVPFDIRQARNAVTLKSSMRGGPGQMWIGWLKSIEAIIQRQLRVHR